MIAGTLAIAVWVIIHMLEGAEPSISMISFIIFYASLGFLIVFLFIPKEIMLEKDGILVKKDLKIKLITSYKNIKEVLLIENSKKTDHFDSNDVIDYGLGDLLKNKNISEMCDINNAVLIKADKTIYWV